MNINKKKSIAALIVGFLLAIIVTIFVNSPANADANSQWGPVATTYTVKGVYGTQASGFYVRYWNGDVKIFPKRSTALAQADDPAEAKKIKTLYGSLSQLQANLNLVGANRVFD